MSKDNFVIQDDVLVEYVGSDQYVDVPSEVRKIGEWAFNGCDQIKSVSMPYNTIKIEKGAFFKCTSLASVNIPGNVEHVGYSAFRGCTNLVAVEYWDGEYECEKTIDECAFAECESLEVIILGVDIVSIGDSAFRGCTNLKAVCYLGSEEDFSWVEIGDNNECLHNATLYLYSDKKPNKNGNYWYYQKGKIVFWEND